MSRPHSLHRGSQSVSKEAVGETPENPRGVGLPETDVALGEFAPTMADVMEAVYDLGPAKREAFQALRANPGSTTRELSEVLSRDRSNVNRSLTALMETGLVTRRRRLLREGGYVYQYTPRSPVEIEVLLQTVLTKWSEAASERVSEFSATTPTNSSELSWVDRMVLAEAGELTATEEFVFHHGVEKRRRTGERLPESIKQGEWSPDRRAEFVASGSREDVEDALDRLQTEGFIEEVEPATEDEWAGPYWRLTPAGDRLQRAVA